MVDMLAAGVSRNTILGAASFCNTFELQYCRFLERVNGIEPSFRLSLRDKSSGQRESNAFIDFVKSAFARSTFKLC
jgi:hypothetical protein